MIRWNLFFEVEKVEQLALIDPLATHHDRPPSLKASGKRNHDSSIFTRPFSTGSVTSRPYAVAQARFALPLKADKRSSGVTGVDAGSAQRAAGRRNYFFTNFFTVLFSVNPPNTLPSLSAATPSGRWGFGPSSVMKAVTLPSLTLPIRMPCRNDMLTFSPDWESAA